MRKTFCISVLGLFLIFGNNHAVYSKENVKVLMTNEWIGKYKKVKKDLENKVARAKDMENLSEKNISDLRDSYARTSLMLENWLLQVVSTLETSEPAQLEYVAKGDLNPDLQKGFQEILTFYADDFATQFEEITGERDKFVVRLDAGNDSRQMDSSVLIQKFEKEELMAGIQPLLPGDWNSIN